MAAKENPGARASATGAGNAFHATADGFSTIARFAPPRHDEDPTVRLRTRRLVLRGIPEAPANALAALIWGAAQ